MTALADRIKKSREIIVKVGNVTFTGARATFEQYAKYYNQGTYDAEVCSNHITGWDGVKEVDTLEGGKDELIPFDKEVFDMIIADRPEWSAPIAKAIVSDALNRTMKKDANEKK